MPDYIPLDIALKKAEEFGYYHNDVNRLIENRKLDVYCYYDGYLGILENFSTDKNSFELDIIGFKKYKGEIKVILNEIILKSIKILLSKKDLDEKILIDYVSILENGSYLEYCIAMLNPEVHNIPLPCKFSLITHKRLEGLWLDISNLFVNKDKLMDEISGKDIYLNQLESLRLENEKLKKEIDALKKAQNLNDIYNHPAFNENSPTCAPEMRTCMELWEFIYKNGKPKFSHEQLANKFLNERSIGKFTVDAEGKIIKESNDRLRLKRVTNVNKR